MFQCSTFFGSPYALRYLPHKVSAAVFTVTVLP